MKKSKEPIKAVQVILTESLHKTLCEYAEKKKWNVSLCVREAIAFYLKEVTRNRKGKKD